MNKVLSLLSALLISFMTSDVRAHADATTHMFSSWDDACLAAEFYVEEGDLIFIDIPNALFGKVVESTGSWTSHVGIAFKNNDGKWVVAESKVPLSKETPLCSYIKRSSKYRFEIRRINHGLSSAEVQLLHMASHDMLGKLYHLGFDFDSSRMYCSKFVYLAYKTIGIEVGEIQTFRELLSARPGTSLSFWKWWYFGSIPWERRTVTPASQLNDSEFWTVLGSY